MASNRSESPKRSTRKALSFGWGFYATSTMVEACGNIGETDVEKVFDPTRFISRTSAVAETCANTCVLSVH